MKTLRLALLMILLAGSAAAQAPSSTSGAPDVAVIKISWSRVDRGNPYLDEATVGPNLERALRTTVNEARARANKSLLSVPAPDAPPPIVPPWAGYLYKFTVKNTGAKTIRKLVFEYAFTDKSTQQKVGRRPYKSKVKIHPGMTATLVARSSLPPIGTIDATQADQNLQEQSPEQMVIQRIEYADGSVWQRGSK